MNFGLLILILSVPFSNTAMADGPTCRDGFLKVEYARYQPGYEVRLEPGNLLPYQSAVNGKARQRYDELYLRVTKNDDLDRLAGVLAMGDPRARGEVRRRLNEARQGGRIALSTLLPEGPLSYTNRFVPEANARSMASLWANSSDSREALSSAELAAKLGHYFLVQPQDSLKYGMLASLHEEGRTPLEHTYIYLNRDFLWHKPSDLADRVTFEAVEDAVGPYWERSGERLRLYFFEPFNMAK